MGADFTIHIFEGITESDMRVFFQHSMGHPYFDLTTPQDFDEYCKASSKIADTPNFCIGEVSWLKAAVFGDDETFVPGPIDKMNELIPADPRPILTEKLRDDLLAAMGIENQTSYTVSEHRKMFEEFLNDHLGKQIFTVSW